MVSHETEAEVVLSTGRCDVDGARRALTRERPWRTQKLEKQDKSRVQECEGRERKMVAARVEY